MKAWGSPAAVIAALRDDAAAEKERLEREAENALARDAVASAADAALPDAGPRLAAARAAIADLTADEDWAETVADAAERDAWIASVVEKGREAIAAAPDALDWTLTLAQEAVRQIPGPASVVSVPAALLSRIDASWRAALEQSTGKKVALEAASFKAGCVARTPDGKITFDNRLESRESRTLYEWRGELARIYRAALDAAVLVPA